MGVNAVLDKLVVPEALEFSQLGLEWEPVTHRLLFAPAPLAALCRFNNLEPEQILVDEDLACWLICEWYLAHREAGGEPDPVAEKILAEVAALQESGIAALQQASGLPN